MWTLYKLIDGDWYFHGEYDTVSSLTSACFELGKLGFGQIKVEEVNNA